MSQIVSGVNDLFTLYPEMKKEWIADKNLGISPTSLGKGSTKKIIWTCSKGHEWKASPNDRLHSGKMSGCPFCSGNAVLIGFNDLATVNPQLASEWDYEANKPLTPEMVTAGSTKKVGWICELGHRWNAVIDSRNSGKGCPYCARKALLRGFNDLATTNPEIAIDWHPTLNGSIHPTDVIMGTHRKVWWKCHVCGYEWLATCNSRQNGNGCEHCDRKLGARQRNQEAVAKRGSILASHPMIAMEWHPTKNKGKKISDYLAGSEQKVWWLGRCGHEWEASIKDRCKKKSGCPFCENKRLLTGFNDLETKAPLIAEEWDYGNNGGLTPSDVMVGAGYCAAWKCRVCGNRWKTKIINRTFAGCGCPKCASERSTSYPEQALYFYLRKLFPDAINRYVIEKRELDIYIPQISIGIEYDGERYHTAEMRPKEEEKDKYFKGCGIDVIRVKETKVNAIEDKTIYYKRTKAGALDGAISDVIRLINELRHMNNTLSVDNQSDMSEILAQFLSLAKENSVASNPDLMKEWNFERNGDLNPQYLSVNSNRLVWWRCALGHEWQSRVYSRNQGHKCVYCQNKKAWPGFNDLATINPSLAEEWDFPKNGEVLPSMVLPYSFKTVWWKCRTCGSEWQAKISTRSSGYNKCPNCGLHK